MQDHLAQLRMKVEQLMAAQDFDGACATFSQEKARTLDAQLLIARSTAIQLAEKSEGFTLDDARASLLEATRLVPSSAEAWTELGHFFYAVDDRPQAGLEAFERAKRIGGPLSADLVNGLAKCLVELGRQQEALDLVAACAFDTGELKANELLAEIRGSL